MPSASAFKKTFNLNKGAILHSQTTGKTVLAEVQKSTIGHTAKRRNELYEFPSTIDLEIKDQSTTRYRLRATLKQLGERIAYSSYGSPYKCSIENIKIESFDPAEAHASITFLGKAIRRRDIPTLRQQKQKEREEKTSAAKKIKDIQISKEDEKRWLLPQMRVIKSRWGSGKCSLCGEPIDQGAKIAKNASSTKRGGWMHAACAVEHVKKTKF